MAHSDAGYSDISTRGALLSLFITLHNHGSTNVRLESIRPAGTGIGTVADVTRVSVADDRSSAAPVTLGGYRTDPPAAKEGGNCITQPLAPVAGFLVKANQTVRIAELINGVSPGRYSQTSILVSYDIGTHRVTQTLTATTLHGRVVERLPSTVRKPDEWQCAAKGDRLPL